MFKPLHTLFLRKFWMDELYENVIVKISLIGGLFSLMEKIDTKVVDGAVNGTAKAIILVGEVVRNIQTGQLQLYGLLIGFGIIIIALFVFIFG